MEVLNQIQTLVRDKLFGAVIILFIERLGKEIEPYMVRCLDSDFWRCCHRVEPRSSSCLAFSCTVAVETDRIVRPI